MNDDVTRIIDERQMWLLCIKADTLGAGKAKAVHAELVEILMAQHSLERRPRMRNS